MPEDPSGLGSLDLQSRAKRKEQTDQRLAMFLAFNGDGRNHFVHTQSYPKHLKRDRAAKRRRHRQRQQGKESDEDAISRTIGELLIDALKTKKKCNRPNSPFDETSYDQGTDLDMDEEPTDTNDLYSDELEPEEDDEYPTDDSPAPVSDDALDEDIFDDYTNENIPDSGEIQIKCTTKSPPTTTQKPITFSTTTPQPHSTTAVVPVTATTRTSHQTTTQQRPCTAPEHVIDGSMSNSQVQNLLKRLLGLHCNCKQSRRRPHTTKPIVVVEDTPRALRRTTTESSTVTPIDVGTTEKIIDHVVFDPPQSKRLFKHLVDSIEVDEELDELIEKHKRIGKKRVANTININVDNEVAKASRPRKTHRTSKPVAQINPTKELHIILDQEDKEIGAVKDVDEKESEELEENEVDDIDGQESQHDLQFFRDQRGRIAKATAAASGKPSRNRRTRNRRRRGRKGRRVGNKSRGSGADSNRKDSLRPEDSVDNQADQAHQQRRAERGIGRRATTTADERRGSSVSGTSGDVAATENSAYRASLPVGLGSADRTRLDVESHDADPQIVALPASQTADLLLKQFLVLYDQFKYVVGNQVERAGDD